MSRKRGITLVEVIVGVAVVVVLLALGFFALSKARRKVRNVYDGVQLRSIQQGFVLGAQGGQDSYLTPSRVDEANTTVVADEPNSKNTTANTYSVLVYNGFISVEILVSPIETNPNIQPFTQYQFSAPPAAAIPTQALWDPAFSADFVSGTGGTSYAHAIPNGRLGGQSPRWSNTFQETEAILGTRGPLTTAHRPDAKGAVLTRFDAGSNTLRFFGKAPAWHGNVAYNDNHVQFEESQALPSTRFAPSRNTVALWEDFLFADEYLPSDTAEPPYSANAYFTNSYLGIFTKAGPTMADYGAIWD